MKINQYINKSISTKVLSPQRGCPQLREPPSPQPARTTRGAVSSPHERRRSLLGLCYPVRRLREKSFSLRLFFTFFFFCNSGVAGYEGEAAAKRGAEQQDEPGPGEPRRLSLVTDPRVGGRLCFQARAWRETPRHFRT